MMNTLNKIEEMVTMAFLAAMVIFVFGAAIMRTFGHPIIWSVDSAQLLFIWICMLGANQTLRMGEHVGVDFLVRRLSRKAHLCLDVFIYSLIAVLLMILIVFGVELTQLNPERLLGTSGLPYALVTVAIPFGATLMLITVMSQILSFIKTLKSLDTADFNVPHLQKYAENKSS